MNKILIVDDEQDICIVLKNVLEQNGFKADYFDEAISALKNFKSGMYDLLLLDIKMPKMDGFELYKELKKIDSKAKPCFLTAGEPYYEQFRKGEEFAALDKDLFLRKPIENEELIRKIKRIMKTN